MCSLQQPQLLISLLNIFRLEIGGSKLKLAECFELRVHSTKRMLPAGQIDLSRHQRRLYIILPLTCISQEVDFPNGVSEAQLESCSQSTFSARAGLRETKVTNGVLDVASSD
ncbi:hypothetical protein RRG08_004565 [Elysia crispata]|uniref:Uncharacterized protein n=1 Tax=Elysia crispata TaxID=231223 RepID=A0AAE1E1K9_9GAST|nr:hypothetical protein RRG08_004565 [Elysia crispata]